MKTIVCHCEHCKNARFRIGRAGNAKSVRHQTNDVRGARNRVKSMLRRGDPDVVQDTLPTHVSVRLYG